MPIPRAKERLNSQNGLLLCPAVLATILLLAVVGWLGGWVAGWKWLVAGKALAANVRSGALAVEVAVVLRWLAVRGSFAVDKRRGPFLSVLDRRIEWPRTASGLACAPPGRCPAPDLALRAPRP